ncbi:hNH endonuclease [Escherichia coli]|uniref:hNH endonuclease n=1 Tax=Escherichia coli TaxID=562 RepID=UPI000BDF9290|nr:hNH endonuclease [Escherichia coli]
MKQMSLIEMDGFLKGKCIPRDLKVNETNAEYLVRKFGELESKIALLEVQLKLSEAAERAWESSMMQACGEDGPKSVADKFAELEAKCAALATDNEKAMEAMRQADAAVKLAHEKFSALAAENAMLKQRTQQLIDIISNTDNDYCMCGSAMKDHVHGGCGYPTGMFDYYYNQWLESDNKTPATDAFLAEVRAQCLNAFIQHHSAELDAHIKNGGEQFDEKSVRIRDIIVSARLFREQIRKGAAL